MPNIILIKFMVTIFIISALLSDCDFGNQYLMNLIYSHQHKPIRNIGKCISILKQNYGVGLH